MRRHTTNEPSGPATAATPSPASTARSTKSSMMRRRLGGVVAMIMMVGVDGEAVDRRAEQRAIGGVASHRIGMPAAADMVVEADHAVGGGHHQMQIVRDQQHAAAARVADAADEREELGLAGDVDALDRLVQHQEFRLAQQ